MTTVVLIGTLDTKGEKHRWVHDQSPGPKGRSSPVICTLGARGAEVGRWPQEIRPDVRRTT
jgi:hypothetical protein